MDALGTAALALEIAKLASFQNASDFKMLTYIRLFDAQHGWAEDGAVSCAQWLAWRVGWGLKAARERLRVAKALEYLPKISEAFRLGTLSYSKVRSMTRVASPDNEDYLLNISLNGTAVHVDKLVRKVRRAFQAQEVAQSHVRYESRSLHTYVDDNGMLVVRAVLPPEEGERFLKSIDAFRDDTPPPPTNEERHEAPHSSIRPQRASMAQRNADALLTMAECALKNDSTASGADRYQVVLHIDKDGAGFEDGRQATDVALSRILCDSSQVLVTEDRAGNPLHVGRKTRRISSSLRRALRRRESVCQFPGCTHTRFLHAHHVHHWARGGKTDIENMLNLCTRHHHDVHEGRYEIRPRSPQEHQKHGSRWRFFAPNGSEIHIAGKLEPFHPNLEASIQRWADDENLELDAQTSLTGWEGERMNYEWALETLCV